MERTIVEPFPFIFDSIENPLMLLTIDGMPGCYVN